MKTVIRRFRWVAVLLPLVAGVARAGVSGPAFHWAAPADLPWIWSSGSDTQNSDHSSHNAVANFGIVANVIGSVGGVTVYIDQENPILSISCSQRLTEITTGRTYASATASLKPNPFPKPLTLGPQSLAVGSVTGLPSTPHSYAVGIYCSIPGVNSNGAASLLYGVQK
jgi:hypothetical protein